MEVAGAFGDLGTLVPFVVAYIGVVKMDPFGVLLAFGFAMIVCGLVYRTPMPVQPMNGGHDCHNPGRADPHHHARDGVGCQPRYRHYLAGARPHRGPLATSPGSSAVQWFSGSFSASAS